ncbi:conserved Plasmodium protein, unknown function [Plasmodium gallinaceum]|uniref:Uncharacterized protein n=1 Tax=Plasmodium gallinaceum TaxID=5849 RepID=A0A1J1GY90_PLAGA|nr:conserved Plasmodium protein, unknown function [Plasmodium gallinaceum]CRG97530.1 conserved Plasmodium protein, unknown function [Plasmodium gallinaceum]
MSSRKFFVKLERKLILFHQVKRFKKPEVEKNENHELKNISKINDNKTYLSSTKISKNNLKININTKNKKDNKLTNNNNNYSDKHNVKRNYTNNMSNSKLTKISSETLGSRDNLHNKLNNNTNNIYNKNHIKINNNNNNINNTNLYINKLHDYLSVVNKSESDKIKINKILNKLKNDNLTIIIILNVLKDLCNLFLKKSSINIDDLIVVDYLNNKNSLKKLKSYFDEYFVHIENYLKSYICFINEENIYDLFKYFYYLNYSLSLNIIELLMERLYLCIDKLDNLKTVQIYYIIQSFYKHFYLKEVDNYFILVINEKLKKSYRENNFFNSFLLSINKDNSNLENNKNTNEEYKFTFNSLFNLNNNDFINDNEHKENLYENPSNEHKNWYNNNELNKINNENPELNLNNESGNIFLNIYNNGDENNRSIKTNKEQNNNFVPLKQLNNLKTNDKDNVVENNEIMLIFKYIQNFHNKMNFFYQYNITNFIEKNKNKFSIDSLLLILNIYINNTNEMLNEQILELLYYNMDNMTENNLILLTNYLSKSKCVIKINKDDINEIAFINKIMYKIKNDKELFIPDNLATIFLNINETINKILNSKDIIKKQDSNVFNNSKKTTNQNGFFNKNGYNNENCIIEPFNEEERSSINMNNDTTTNNKNDEQIYINEINDNKSVERNENSSDNSKNEKNDQIINYDNLRSYFMNELIKFCDDYINNISSFKSIFNLYLIYIKNEGIKNKTISVFEQKIKMNKNKITKENISNIILSLSIYPYHTTQMFTYLENVINEKLMNINDNFSCEYNINEKNIDENFVNIDANYLIDISLALGISGRKNLKLWKFIDVHKIILTCNKKLLLYLSYSFLLTNYFCSLSWFFIIKRIVEDIKVFNKKQCELLYEILKCSVLFNCVDLNNFTCNSLESNNNIKKKLSNNNNNKNEADNFLKNFHYLLNTSYYHYKIKLINNQYNSKVPYEEIFNYLKLNYEKNIEFKQLYIIPYLLKDYKVIIDPLPSTPIHKSSGFIMGEIQLKHKVFQYDNYVVLSFYDGMWNKFIKSSEDNGKYIYDIKSLSEHFKTYIESHVKIEISKNNINNTPSNEIKQTNSVNYLKYKRPNLPSEFNNKYLINKTNNTNNYQDQNKYLKIKTKINKK